MNISIIIQRPLPLIISLSTSPAAAYTAPTAMPPVFSQ